MAVKLADLQQIPNAAQPTPGLGVTLGLNGKLPQAVLPQMVTGIIPAAGTTPTAGTGFTYTHTNGTGVYVFTFTAAFAARPIILLSSEQLGTEVYASSESTTGFTANTFTTSTGLGGTDYPFEFVAVSVI